MTSTRHSGASLMQNIKSGEESRMQSQNFWRNKHMQSHRILLLSGAIYWQGIYKRIHLHSCFSTSLQQWRTDMIPTFRCLYSVILAAGWRGNVFHTERRGEKRKGSHKVKMCSASVEHTMEVLSKCYHTFSLIRWRLPSLPQRFSCSDRWPNETQLLWVTFWNSLGLKLGNIWNASTQLSKI